MDDFHYRTTCCGLWSVVHYFLQPGTAFNQYSILSGCFPAVSCFIAHVTAQILHFHYCRHLCCEIGIQTLAGMCYSIGKNKKVKRQQDGHRPFLMARSFSARLLIFSVLTDLCSLISNHHGMLNFTQMLDDFIWFV